MNKIIMIVKIELYKLICQRYFLILLCGFILFLMGFGWIRLKISGYMETPLSGFQLAAFIVSAGANLLVLIMIILSSSALASERSYRTLSLLCVRPVSRMQLVSGKLLYVFCVAVFLLLLLFIVSLVTGACLIGLESLSENEYIIYSFLQLLKHYMAGFWFSILPVLTWCSIAFFLSTLIDSPLWANASSLFIFFCFYLLLPFDEFIYFTPSQFLNAGMGMMCKITQGLPAIWEPFYRLSLFSFIYVLVFSCLPVILFQKKDILG